MLLDAAYAMLMLMPPLLPYMLLMPFR